MARILIVDNDSQLRRTLGLALSVRGYEIIESANGADTLRLIKTAHPDRVVLDWQMPGMDGLQTCLAIRASDELSTQTVPIIACSSVDRGDEAISAGASDFIRKPFDIADLVDRISAALR